MRSHNLEVDMLLRGIVMSRGDDGATIAEMRADYFEIKQEPWPLQYQSTDRIRKYLMQIDGLVLYREASGLCIWYIDDLGNVTHQQQDQNNNNIATVSSWTATTADSRTIDTENRFFSTKSIPSIVSVSMESGVQLLESETASDKLPDGYAPPKSKRTFAHQSVAEPNRSKRPKTVPLSELNVELHDEWTTLAEPRRKKKTTSTELGTQNTSNGLISLQNSLTEIDSQEFNR